MTDHLYKVVFSGQISEDISLEEVKNNLSKNLRLPREKVERLFSGNPLVVKKDIDYKTGKRYQHVFTKSGAKCDLIRIEESNNPDQLERETSAPDQPSASTLLQEVTCPRCGLEQKPSEECIKCGIVFKKHKKEKTDAEEIEKTVKIQRKESKNKDVEEETTNHDLFDLQDLIQKIRRKEFLILARKLLFARLPTIESGKQVFLAILQTVFSIGLVLALYMFVLYTISGFWSIYTSTQVGKFYADQILEPSHFFYEILEYDVLYLSFSTTIISLLTCLTIAAAGKLLGLNLYFYYSRGIIAKFILWAAPLTFLSACTIQRFYGFDSFWTAIAAAFLPTFCLLASCLGLIEHLLPTLFDVIGNTVRLLSVLFDFFRRLILKVFPPNKENTEEDKDLSDITEGTETAG